MRKYSNFSLPRRVIEQIDANVKSVREMREAIPGPYKTQYDRAEEVESCMRGFIELPDKIDPDSVLYLSFLDMTRDQKETEKIQYHVDETLSDTFKARAKELKLKYSTALILGLCAK